MPSADASMHADVHADDYYKVLGVARSATKAEITKAYKKMALKYHPDKNPDDREKSEEAFKRIAEAFAVLNDDEKRKHYDQFGKDGPRQGPSGQNETGGEGVGFHGSGGHMSQDEAEKMFRMFFGDAGLGSGGSFVFSQGGGNGNGGTNFMFSRATPGGGMQYSSSSSGPGHPYEDDDGVGMGGMGGFSGMPGGMNMGMGPMGMGMGGLGGMFSGLSGGGMPGPAAGGRPMGAGAKRQRQGRGPRSLELPAGTQVMIRGLTNAAEHNGRPAAVVSFDESRERYIVRLQSGIELSVRPSNVLQQCEVQVLGLSSRLELNGQRGQVVGLDEESGRYLVLMHSPSTVVSLQRGNCVLRQGERVVLSGLSNKRFNGQMACIVAVDRGAGKYTVRCRGGDEIKVKFDKVIC